METVPPSLLIYGIPHQGGFARLNVNLAMAADQDKHPDLPQDVTIVVLTACAAAYS